MQGVRVSAVRLSIRADLMNDGVRERKGTGTGRIADSHYVMLCSTWHTPPHHVGSKFRPPCQIFLSFAQVHKIFLRFKLKGYYLSALLPFPVPLVRLLPSWVGRQGPPDCSVCSSSSCHVVVLFF